MFRSPAIVAFAIIISLMIQAVPIYEVEGAAPLFSPISLNEDSYTVLGRDDTLSILGGESGVPFGEGLAAGDLDGDGRDDIIIGIPDSGLGPGGGAVLVYFAREPDELFSLIGHYDADLVIMADDEDDWFGSSLLAKDMNGDGRDELVIGAPFADGPGNTRRDSGEVYVISGRQRISFGTEMEIGRVGLFAHIYGREGGDRLGSDIEVGDLTDDDQPELIIRSEGHGGMKDPILSEYDNECFGSWEIEVINGDMNGIGSVDLSITPPMVRYFGEAVNTADLFPTHIGNGLAVGDMNGDGVDDLSFSYRFRSNGYAAVFLGSIIYPNVPVGTDVQVHEGADFDPEVHIDLGPEGWEEASLSFGVLGGDPMDDLVVGLPFAPASDTWRKKAGQVDIYEGRQVPVDITIDRAEANTTIWGIDSSDNLGSSNLGIDIDGDGIEELLIAVPGGDGVDNLEPNIGEAYLFDLDGVFPTDLDFRDSSMAFTGRSRGSGAFWRMASCEMLIDGYNELLVSSPIEPVELGSFSGTGLVSLLSQRSTFEASFVGAFNASAFGSSIVIDDLNMDGEKDLIIGDPLGGEGRPGSAHTFLGGSNGWNGRYFATSDADIFYSQAEDVSKFGIVMDTGDLNDDGYPDLAIGAPLDYIGFNADAGSINIYWGGDNSSLASKGNKRITGYSVERVGYSITIGDFNGDLIMDLAFSSPYDDGTRSSGRYHAGVVYIFFGPISSGSQGSSSANVRIIGAAANEFIGETLATGDIDGDGIDELIIGAPKSNLGSITRQGVTYVMNGRSNWPSTIDLSSDESVRIFGPWPFDEVGSSLACGDIDGDGRSELLMGAQNGDGYQRSVQNAGNSYFLKGEYIASMLPSGNITLRDQANVTLCGHQIDQRTGSALAFGDVEGDGDIDIFIGSKGFTDTVSGHRTGGVHVFPSELFSDRLTINTSSLPAIYGFSLDDEAGSSLAAEDINGDLRIDLLIGAPGSDPMGDGSSPGAVYLWEGKDLFSLPYRASQMEIINSPSIAGPINRPLKVLAPEEGPYIFKMSARAMGGYDEIDTVSMMILSGSATGSASLIFDTSDESFTVDSTGDFQGQLTIDDTVSRAWTDGVQTWFLEFGLQVGWELPDPDQIITRAEGISTDHYNYLNDEFVVDRLVTVIDNSMEILDSSGEEARGWMNADSEFSVLNLTLYHGLSGIGFGTNSSDDIEVKLKRSDGVVIGTGNMNGSRIDFPVTTPGDGIYGRGVDYLVTNGSLPRGAIWTDNITFELDVDTVAPPPVSSFRIFPDGKEDGIGEIDDDQVVEVFWENIADQGGSGISKYIVYVLDAENEIISKMDYLNPGDLVQLAQGSYTFTIAAYDKAGNKGPMENRSLIIDVEEPRFSNPFPDENTWITGVTNSFSIEVQDPGSGIDPETAMYRIYRSDVGVLGDWIGIKEFTSLEDHIRLNTTVPEADGYGHYIQWKVEDMAGRLSLSLPYSYNMDTGLPTIEIGDQDGMTVGPEPFNIECYVEDTLSGVSLNSIRYKIGSRDDFWELPWIDVGLTGVGASASPTVQVLPAYRGWGFAQWSVSDVAGNSVESDLISIYIDEVFPSFTGFDPNGTIVLPDTEVEVTAFITDEGAGIDPQEVEYSLSTISGWVHYGVGVFSPWEPVDDLEDRGSGSYAAMVNVKLDEGPFNLIRFRVVDMAGNGWVVSSSISLEVKVTVIDLPPTVAFAMYPATEIITKGDSITLDASSSFDPEGKNLSFTWYSDLENYPQSESIGSGEMVNITLERPGVHRLWVVVSDGINIVESETMLLNVEDPGGNVEPTDGSKDDMWDWFQDWLPFLIFALLLGIILGALFAYFIIGRREILIEESGQPMVDAHYEPDYFVPRCPYCGTDVKMSDEYCMKCGTVFSAEDKKKMEKKGKKSRRKRKKEYLPEKSEEEDLYTDLDWAEEEYEEEIEEEELEDDFFASEEEIEEEEDLIPIEEEILDLEEEEIEDYYEEEVDEEDLDDEDLEEIEENEWEVDE